MTINPKSNPLPCSHATPLQLSVFAGRVGATRLLLNAKADTTLHYEDGPGLTGLSILSVAKGRGHTQVVAMLLESQKEGS